MIKRQRLMEQSVGHLTASSGGGSSTHEPGLVGGAHAGAYRAHANHVTHMLERLDAFVQGQVSAPVANSRLWL